MMVWYLRRARARGSDVTEEEEVRVRAAHMGGSMRLALTVHARSLPSRKRVRVTRIVDAKVRTAVLQREATPTRDKPGPKAHVVAVHEAHRVPFAVDDLEAHRVAAARGSVRESE